MKLNLHEASMIEVMIFILRKGDLGVTMIIHGQVTEEGHRQTDRVTGGKQTSLVIRPYFGSMRSWNAMICRP